MALGKTLEYLKVLENEELSEISSDEDDDSTNDIDLMIIPPGADVVTDEEYIDDVLIVL